MVSNINFLCRQIPSGLVEEVDRSDMIPHEVSGAHSVSCLDCILSGLRPAAVCL